MKCANSNKDIILPVVHIRIVRDIGVHKYACDFCQKSFESADDLAQHVYSSHSSLNIQEVYVCPSCRCCLLSHNDLLDHLSARHHVETDNRENSTLCEYCGLNLTSNRCLLDHLVLEHYSGTTEACVTALGIVELSLKDISSMGMGNPDCKTLFQVIEVSLTKYIENLSESMKKATKNNCVKTGNLKIGNEGIMNTDISLEDTSQQCSKNINIISNFGSTGRYFNSITKTVQGFPNICGNSLNEIIYEQNKQEDCESRLEMIICCDTEDKSAAASSPGEIILTIESEEELIWSKDIMSQVICSSGILKRTPGTSEEKEPVSQSVRVEQVKNNSGSGYSLEVNNVNQGWQQTHCGRKHKDGILAKQCDLNKHDPEINFTKPPVMDKSCNWQSSSSVKNGGSKNVKTSFSAQRGQKEKVCDICKMVFTHRESLEQHENTCHGIRIKCDLCDDSFVFSKSLSNHHLRKHASNDGFKCEDCDKMFKCRSNLWSHRLVHLSQEMRRFQCPQCPQRFTTKSKLNIHLRIHTGEKKFQCGQCEKGFAYQSLLVHHMQKHVPSREIVLG